MIFSYYSKSAAPLQGTYTPMVWIMGQIMTLSLDIIEEVDEAEDTRETPSSPLVPAQSTEIVSFPYLEDYCQRIGDFAMAYLFEKMCREEAENNPDLEASSLTEHVSDPTPSASDVRRGSIPKPARRTPVSYQYF